MTHFPEPLIPQCCDECADDARHCAHEWSQPRAADRGPGTEWHECVFCGTQEDIRPQRAAADELARLTDEMGLYRTDQEAS